MKSLFIFLTIFSSHFAIANNHPKDIAPAAATAFQTAFKGATNVHWCVLGDLYHAQFTYNNQELHAFYDRQGECINIGKMIEFKNLPATLQVAFEAKKVAGTIIEVFELSNESDLSYHIIVETATGEITFKSSGAARWNILHKRKFK